MQERLELAESGHSRALFGNFRPFIREGKIVGVLGDTNAPHPVIKLEDPNQICVRSHIVEGKRWDTFFGFPPCGTVAEIESTLAAFPDKQDLEYLTMLMEDRKTGSERSIDEPFNIPDPGAMTPGKSGEITTSGTRALGYVRCHMPLLNRPLVHTIKRTLMWRPFIVDLWDTRLARWQPQRFEMEVPVGRAEQ